MRMRRSSDGQSMPGTAKVLAYSSVEDGGFDGLIVSADAVYRVGSAAVSATAPRALSQLDGVARRRLCARHCSMTSASPLTPARRGLRSGPPLSLRAGAVALALALAPWLSCGGSTTGDGGGDTDPQLGFGVCDAPSPLAGGWVRCGQGFEHRAEVAECPSAVPRPEPIEPSPFIDPAAVQCSSDAECGHLAHGHCYAPSVWDVPRCTAGCVVDSDCGGGEVCYCAEPVGHCMTASCQSDADCGPDALCATYTTRGDCLAAIAGVACQRAGDECLSAEDCEAVGAPRCGLDEQSDRRVCGEGLGGCGG